MSKPFVVDGEERVGTAMSRNDWVASDLAPRVEGVSPELRERLAAHWARVGSKKHASIAAFARFALQLLSHGAPPELLSRTHSAMSDETRHARFAFALAAGYAGKPLGPGPLPLDGALGEDTLEKMLASLIADGCVGDAVAGRVAKDAVEHVEDPALRFVLREIARDAAEHALLAWRSVVWIAEAFGERADPVLRESITTLRASLATLPTEATDDELAVFGVVSDSMVGVLRRDVIEHATLGGLEAVLFGEPPPASTEGGRLTLV